MSPAFFILYWFPIISWEHIDIFYRIWFPEAPNESVLEKSLASYSEHTYADRFLIASGYMFVSYYILLRVHISTVLRSEFFSLLGNNFSSLRDSRKLLRIRPGKWHVITCAYNTIIRSTVYVPVHIGVWVVTAPESDTLCTNTMDMF